MSSATVNNFRLNFSKWISQYQNAQFAMNIFVMNLPRRILWLLDILRMINFMKKTSKLLQFSVNYIQQCLEFESKFHSYLLFLDIFLDAELFPQLAEWRNKLGKFWQSLWLSQIQCPYGLSIQYLIIYYFFT